MTEAGKNKKESISAQELGAVSSVPKNKNEYQESELRWPKREKQRKYRSATKINTRKPIKREKKRKKLKKVSQRDYKINT